MALGKVTGILSLEWEGGVAWDTEVKKEEGKVCGYDSLHKEIAVISL